MTDSRPSAPASALDMATLGISESDLLEPCTNIKVGAWLLADSFARRGVSWDAVGAYNAAMLALDGSLLGAVGAAGIPGAAPARASGAAGPAGASSWDLGAGAGTRRIGVRGGP